MRRRTDFQGTGLVAAAAAAVGLLLLGVAAGVAAAARRPAAHPAAPAQLRLVPPLRLEVQGAGWALYEGTPAGGWRLRLAGLEDLRGGGA